MTKAEQEALLMQIDEAFGFTKHDFTKDLNGNKVPIYTRWGEGDTATDIEDLGDVSFKISKKLGDIYINKIHTNKWIIVGKGTRLHCDDLHAGEALVENFEGFLM